MLKLLRVSPLWFGPAILFHDFLSMLFQILVKWFVCRDVDYVYIIVLGLEMVDGGGCF